MGEAQDPTTARARQKEFLAESERVGALSRQNPPQRVLSGRSVQGRTLEWSGSGFEACLGVPKAIRWRATGSLSVALRAEPGDLSVSVHPIINVGLALETGDFSWFGAWVLSDDSQSSSEVRMGRKVTLVFAMRHYAGNALKREGIKMGDALDEIFEQTSLRANEGTRRGGKGYRFNLSPNLEHTAVQRKKKKASAPAPSDGSPRRHRPYRNATVPASAG